MLGALHLDGGSDRVDHAMVFDQQPVAHGLDQATVVRRDDGLNDFMQIGLEPSARPFLIGLAQATIADDVGNQDGDESALHAPVPG